MNAYELAEIVDKWAYSESAEYLTDAANMLRQQADRIAELEKKPQKYCPSENNEAYEKGFIDGMAKQRESSIDKWVNAQTKPLSNDEILEMTIWNKNVYELYVEMEKEDMIAFARAIEERHGIK